MPNDVHSCSYFCDRPECIKAQRNELRDEDGNENTVKLPPDWRREGMLVVVDSITGQLLGYIGMNTFGALLSASLSPTNNEGE